MIIINLLLFLLGQYFSFVAIWGPSRVYLPSNSPRHSYLFMYASRPQEGVSVYIDIPFPSPKQLDYLVFRGCPQAQEVKRPQTALLIQT